MAPTLMPSIIWHAGLGVLAFWLSRTPFQCSFEECTIRTYVILTPWAPVRAKNGTLQTDRQTEDRPIASNENENLIISHT